MNAGTGPGAVRPDDEDLHDDRHDGEVDDGLGAVLAQLTSTEVLDLVPRLTLLLAFPVERFADQPALVVVSALAWALAVLWRPLYRSPWLFLALGAARGVDHLLGWEGIDDHVVLVTYWTLAVGLALLCRDPVRALARSGAALIGLTFVFATFWKLTSPDFADGTFFEYTLLVDPRFEAFARLVGGASAGTLEAATGAFDAVRNDGTARTVGSSSRLALTALVMTWWGIVVEATLAVSWTLPRHTRRWEDLRVASLVAFCVTTYLVVPVTYFGAVLVTMAIAASPARLRTPLLVTLAFVVLWAPVWNLLTGAVTG